MEATVQRTDSQRLQPNGPRVSFNRDVHVKRIGNRPNEKSNYKIETTNLQPPDNQHLRRELPADLSEEGIRKEAALILAQAERIKCKAESGSTNPSQIKNSNHKRSIPNKFHSLPTRKKKPVGKAVSRSVSDASSKKSKKPSIFNIFSRKSDSNLLDKEQQQRGSRLSESGGRGIVRSKSDVGSNKEPKFVSKKRNPEKEDLATGGVGNGTGKSTQLSPIIENTQKEEYFEELFNRERRKSEAITADEKNATELKDFLSKYNTEPKLSGNIGYTNHQDLDLVPSKPIAETIQALQQDKTKSLEDMHSSQLPPRKPALTKGLTVNGMVKRLSMERFSPPPTISGPAFSYTRPNEQIVYAQLAEEERPLKRPTAFNTPLRQNHNGILPNRNSVDVFDHPSSHHTTSSMRKETPSRVIHSPVREPFTPVTGTTMIRIQNSPSPWQQLSPRNLSDDDEGLGVETRKYFEEESHHQSYQRNKNSSEVPIVPVIRSITPPNPMHQKPFDEINTLSRRRANLESRIRSRRFATPEIVSKEYRASPDRNRVHEEYYDSNPRQYSTPEREDYSRYHKLRSEEVMKKYSPERSHLDMIAPNKSGNGHHSSRYVHTKYYDDGTGGVKEIYERESKTDDQGKPIVRESRRRERFDSPGRMIDQNVTVNDYEPRSFDSHLLNSTDMYRSSPENHKLVSSISQLNSSEAENWQNSLKRDKRQQRSFDKGDSGIENDFRKETFNGDGSSKWRKRTFKDDVTACELFIKKERRHTEDQHPQRKRYNFVYRERSIDDGSHFDPRLDKYPKTSSSTLRRSGKENSSSTAATSHSHMEDTLKRNKKVGGFQKVKLLFSGNRKKELDTGVMVNGKSEFSQHNGGVKDKYMVKEEEMRSRYREHRGSHQNDLREPKIATDISMRRRLSTPKASPLLKRTSSESTRKNSPLASKNSTEVKQEKSSWFKSIDRRSKSKSKEKLDPPPSVESGSIHTVKNRSYRTPPPAPPIPPKNFRFFGDTDLDSNPPTVSRVNTTPRSRPSLSTLNRTQKYSQSAFHLDRINQAPQTAKSSRLRSSSLQNLEEDGTDETDTNKRRHYSRSRNLDDISESGSETEDHYRRQPLTPVNRSVSREKLDHSYRHDDRKRSDRQHSATSTLKRTPDQPSSIEMYKQKANALPKPLRNAERRFHAREHERLPDSSGTEGESSMQSQRSVVYLHATTIGAIPQPYQTSSRRRAASREDLRKNKLQPMTKSVSRSVSMLAPWKPKHISEGYEINYSQEQNEKDKKLLTLPRKTTSTQVSSSSTLNRHKKIEPPTRARRQATSAKSKDDLSSIRHSSSTSAPKSNLSSTIDSRKETLRRK